MVNCVLSLETCMLGTLIGLLTGGTWKLYAIGALALVAVAYVVDVEWALDRRDRTIAELRGAEARRVARANLDALDAYRKRADAVNVALMAERDRARQSAQTASEALRRLTAAKDRQEPVSEALDGVLDALGPPKVPK